jgi:hypothetical protein
MYLQKKKKINEIFIIFSLEQDHQTHTMCICIHIKEIFVYLIFFNSFFFSLKCLRLKKKKKKKKKKKTASTEIHTFKEILYILFSLTVFFFFSVDAEFFFFFFFFFEVFET